MNSSEENPAKSDPKTKTEINKGLSNAQNISEESKRKHVKLRNDQENTNARLRELEGKEKELESLRKDLENANSRINELKETEKELGSLHNDFENANIRIKELEKKEKELESRRKDLEDANSRIKVLEGKEKELGSWRRDLEKANSRIRELKEKEKEMGSLRKDVENANSRIKELEEKEKALETLHKDSENKSSPQQELIAEKQKTKEASPEYSRPGKAAFILDLYPCEGHYQGKVKHLPTQDEKLIKGIDDKDFAAFINEYLPKLEESSVTPEPVAPVPAKPSMETQIPAIKTVSIRRFNLVQQGKFQKEKSIPHDRIFQVTLVVDLLESIVEENLPCPFNISVYAKRMGGGFKQTLGKSRGKITTAGEFTANVHCVPLPSGIYRFVAFGTINIKNDLKESIVQFHESSMFSVA